MAGARIPGTQKRRRIDRGTTTRQRTPRPGTVGSTIKASRTPTIVVKTKVDVFIMSVQDLQETLADSGLHDKDIAEDGMSVREIFDKIVPVLRKVGFTGKVRLDTNPAGKKYMILTDVSRDTKFGNFLRGTRYLEGNMQVAKLLLATPAKVAEDVFHGTLIGIVVVGGADWLEYYLTKPSLRGDLAQHIAADEMVGLTAAVAGGLATAGALAIGAPAIVIIGAGLVVSFLMSELIEHSAAKGFVDRTAEEMVRYCRKKEQKAEDDMSDFIAIHFME